MLPEEKLDHLKRALSQLPPAHYHTLKYLMAHLHRYDYRQVSNIRRTKSQHLKDSRTVLRLSLSYPLKPDVKSRMKM